ncbi:BQ5605_C005g03357 [Microbotryum silenes-dioicae]|uniref:BQ5605_C005g03357 protein n=1 Tax=Microbotryum silenes-dioicae TaxID=796604 RepID=A0A2X0PCL8_9BASI|nr:BQ5605_C005g03357 [Microbotryum silenes-dioicae]
MSNESIQTIQGIKSGQRQRPDSIALPARDDFALTSPLSPPASTTSSGGASSVDRPGGALPSSRLFPMRNVMHYHSSKGKERAAPMSPGSPPSSGYPIMSPAFSRASGTSALTSSIEPFTFHASAMPTTRKLASRPETPGTASSAPTVPSEGAQSDIPLLMTARFEHSVAPDGSHHVLTGRDGVMERCEDEPIWLPGAIQAFGVLIAFEEQPDGKLRVQQVSENSNFILGMRPNDFFCTQCLTSLLDPEEADALRDALEALDDRDADSANLYEGPINFQLSGTGRPGSAAADAQDSSRLEWSCHAALHRPDRVNRPKMAVLELELMDDTVNPLTTESTEPALHEEKGGMETDQPFEPTEEDLQESTVSLVKPLRSLARMKRQRRAKRSQADVDVVTLLSNINNQLSKAEDLNVFLRITAGVFKELTEFDRAMVYQFDEKWNGRVVAEQVDWSRTKDLFRGLNFPASDIPAQARELYRVNKVRLLYDRDQPTARLCCRDVSEVDNPLDMTHCHLRAMSPIHIKYLGNMGVRSSMSISITAFGDLWGLVALHTYGRYGHRVSFPVRQLCKLLGSSISRNIERLSYAKRLHARKLINTAPSEANPSGYILAKSEDLLLLFDADFGVLSIGDEAKILGSVVNSQELLAVLEYLRVKQFTTMQHSQDIRADYNDIDYPGPFEMIAGLLAVPLSSEGRDFIVFFRRGQLQEVKWAGNPYANKTEDGDVGQRLEPRKSFKTWSEVVLGKCRAWTDEQMETAGVLCLVYGKFITVWREKESALKTSQLNSLLLANASHEVRTPLNAIINYLELALDSEVTGEVRENLTRSHAASRSLIHVINDLLDLTRTERGQDLYLQDPFNLSTTLEDALSVHRAEAKRRGITLDVVETPQGTPTNLLGDRGKIRTIVSNIVGNAVKHTKSSGSVTVEWGEMTDVDLEDAMDKKTDSIRIGLSMIDTGVGISESRLESLFREFEQVSTVGDDQGGEVASSGGTVGLGLAVVARIIRNLGGQLRVESKEGEGSKFMVIIPFRLPQQPISPPSSSTMDDDTSAASSRTMSIANGHRSMTRSNSTGSAGSKNSDIDSIISAMSSSHISPGAARHMTSGNQRMLQAKTSRASNPSTSNRSNRSEGSMRSNRSYNSTGTVGSKARSNGSIEIDSSNVALRAIRVPPLMRSAQELNSPDGDQERTIVRRGSLTRTGSRSGVLASSEEHRGEINAAPATTKRITNNRAAIASPTSSTRMDFADAIAKQDGAVETGDASLQPLIESPIHVSQYKASPPAVQEDNVPSMRVLVVEDELVNRMILQKRLTKDGHDVVVVEHGGDAVRLFKEDRQFDCILMDLQMPIMGGLEATRQIRRIEHDEPVSLAQQRPSSILNGQIPILAVSASLPERERPLIVEAGMDGWCLKPVDVKRLRKLMRGAIDVAVRSEDVYQAGSFEKGGWNFEAPSHRPSKPDVADWVQNLSK